MTEPHSFQMTKLDGSMGLQRVYIYKPVLFFIILFMNWFVEINYHIYAFINIAYTYVTILKKIYYKLVESRTCLRKTAALKLYFNLNFFNI